MVNPVGARSKDSSMRNNSEECEDTQEREQECNTHESLGVQIDQSLPSLLLNVDRHWSTADNPTASTSTYATAGSISLTNPNRVTNAERTAPPKATPSDEMPSPRTNRYS